jgi:hypothetical protein
MASPAWAAKKMTVQELKETLVSLQQAKKTDAEVSTELKQVELSEQLTLGTMNSLIHVTPGPRSTEQIFVLEAQSAVLTPPASDLPSMPAPDAAAQKALFDKAIDYSSRIYTQLPHLTATRTSLRFQDNVEAVKGSSGMNSSAEILDTNLINPPNFVHLIGTAETLAESTNGIEKPAAAKDKTLWGQNGQIALRGPGPVLSAILQEAQSAGKITWLRWEKVNNKPTAVYAFDVDKKQSHYAVDYCCFPNVSQAGSLRYDMSGTTHTATGNMQTVSRWSAFKATVPYHGEIFVDPNTGIVVRLVTIAEFNSSDVVHQEDQRIDYAPVKVDAKVLVLPVRKVINTEIVPNGDSGAGKYSTRHTLFTIEYKNYQMKK